MSNDIDSSQDYLDVRDIIARVEEQQEILLASYNQQGEEQTGDDWETQDADSDMFLAWLSENVDDEEKQELLTLTQLLDDLKDNGGDEQWKGDWYPVTLIRDNYFEQAMDEMLEDCGDMKPYDQIPSYLTIVVDYDALQQDYSSVEFDGETYWYR